MHRVVRYAAPAAAAAAAAMYVTTNKSTTNIAHCENPVPSTSTSLVTKPTPHRPPQPRADMVTKLKTEPFDVLVIGGGATGAGVALDAAVRGLSVAMIERDDFAAETSSKSTKLVHGGVRYLEKAVFNLDLSQFDLVKEALNERETVLQMAPHLAHQAPIAVPLYKWWMVPYYWVGLKAYEFIARLHYRSLFGPEVKPSFYMNAHETLEELPALRSTGLCGSIVYYDGQFDDAGMNLAVVLSAVDAGATVLNHMEATSLTKNGEGIITGAHVVDRLTGDQVDIKAKVVINATGPFADSIRKMDSETQPTIVQGSSGIHITLPAYFGSQTLGMLDPQTSDGRVVFMLPWQNVLLVGTTDTPVPITTGPVPDGPSVDFVLAEFRKFLAPNVMVTREHVLSAWCGIRPLVNPPASAKGSTQEIVRSHYIDVSPTGLVTVTGGKWTTFRRMAADTVDAAVKSVGIPAPSSTTDRMRLRGGTNFTHSLFIEMIQSYRVDEKIARYVTERYGDYAPVVLARATANGTKKAVRLHPDYPYLETQVEIAVQEEYACNAVDVLARRLRLAFVDSRAALEVLPRVLAIMAPLLGWNAKRVEAERQSATKYFESMTVQKQ